MRPTPIPPMPAPAPMRVAEIGGVPAGDAEVARGGRHAGTAATLRADVCNETAASHYAQALDALAASGTDGVSLSLTLPFCAAHCLCCARDVHAAQPAAVIHRYVGALIDEMHLVTTHGVGGRDLLQLHLGGGTANELDDLELLRLMHAIRAEWRLPADAEQSVDYDPRRASRSQLQLLRNLGFRRITFGVLDLDPAVQRAIGRLQSGALIEDACALARGCGIDLVTLELMLGLPEQNASRWRATLQCLVEIGPDRVTLSQYRHQPWNAPSQFAIDADALPDAQALRALVVLTAEMLGGAGYRRIGADHWVLDTDELASPMESLHRSLISYTVRPEVAVLGLGAGAVGRLGEHTFRNVAALSPWQQAVAAGTLPVAHMARAGAAPGPLGSSAEVTWLS